MLFVSAGHSLQNRLLRLLNTGYSGIPVRFLDYKGSDNFYSYSIAGSDQGADDFGIFQESKR